MGGREPRALPRAGIERAFCAKAIGHPSTLESERVWIAPRQSSSMHPNTMWTILLLIGSNIFMTFAWYGHLKFREVALWKVILVSWGIALFEYCLQVPANRLGARQF